MTAVQRAIADDVTIIVPTLGGPVLQGCLESIMNGTVWPARLVVIDQGGGTAAADWVGAMRTQGMDVLLEPTNRAGISAATNRGLARVRTRYAAVTHDDCRVRFDWLERLAARLAELEDAILTGRVEPEGEGIVLTVKTTERPAIYTSPLLDGDVLFPPNMAF